MPTITAISAQQRNHERVNIFVDGEFVMGLAMALASELQIGSSWDEALQNELMARDAREKAKQQAIRFLSLRPRSAFEIRQNLKRKEVPDVVIQDVLEELISRGYVDDLAFAQFWIEQRETFKPRGARAIRYELRQKGVEGSVIDHALRDLDELANARAAAASQAARYEKLPKDGFRRKFGAYLQRRGFNYAVIKQVLEETWQTLHGADIE